MGSANCFARGVLAPAQDRPPHLFASELVSMLLPGEPSLLRVQGLVQSLRCSYARSGAADLLLLGPGAP